VAEFLSMGGYAMYVWPAFFITLVVLVANVLLSKSQYKRVLKETGMRVEALAQSKATRSTSSTESNS